MKRLVILTALVSLGALSAPSAAVLASERPPGRPILAKPAHENVLRVADPTSPTTGEKKGNAQGEKKGGKGPKGTTTSNPTASGKAPAGAGAATATVKPKPNQGATTRGAVAGSSRPGGTSPHGSTGTASLPPGVPQGAVMVPGSAGNPPTYVMPNTGGSEQYQSNGAGQYERVKPPAGIQ